MGKYTGIHKKYLDARFVLVKPDSIVLKIKCKIEKLASTEFPKESIHEAIIQFYNRAEQVSSW